MDERYHLEKSTAAACRYFRDSYQRFGNWTLVAAAYNAGNRRIRESMEEQKKSSYYELLLSEETSRYVFRILAIKSIFEQPTKYGYFLREKDFYPPIPVKTVTIEDDVKDLVSFAAEHGISYKVLKIFNPWLRKNSLKVGKGKTYQVRIPHDIYMDYDELLDELNDDPIIFMDTLEFEEL